MSGLDALVSYAYFKTKDLGAIRDAIGPDGLLVIDSGAFTVKNTGRPITVEEYAEFLHRWEGAYDWAFTLDVIGDAEATAANLARLKALKVKNLVPIHTAVAPLDDFDRLCEEWPLVGTGGLANRQARAYVGEAVNNVYAERAAERGAAVHFLGFIRTNLLMAARPYSGDSSAPSQALSYGKVCCWDGQNVTTGFHYDRRFVERNKDVLTAAGLSLRKLLSGRGQESTADQHLLSMVGVWSIGLGGLYVRRIADSLVSPEGMPGGPRLICAWHPGYWKSYMDAAIAWRTHTCPSRLETIRARYGDPKPEEVAV